MISLFSPLIRSVASLLVAGFISSTPALGWWDPDYTARKKITIDTSSAGANLTETPGAAGVPILIRLPEGFNFDDAKTDGSGLRFVADDDKTVLSFAVDQMNADLAEGFVWVNVPNIKPGAQTTIWLYSGNSNANKSAPGAPGSKKIYDADTVLVYHFAETKPHDASGNGNDSETTILTSDGSIIGSGLQVNGKVPVIIKASDSLKWMDASPLTISAWVKLTTLVPNAVLLSRRESGKSLIIGFDSGTPFVELNGQRTNAGASVAVNTWKHLALVADAGKITLYFDGASVATADGALPGLSSDITLDADPSAPPGGAGVVGQVDELQIAKAARPAAYIKLAAASQGSDNAKVVAIGSDEQQPAGWLSGGLGLFGVILKSVTIDGWVVIGFLAILAAVSWYVMITKYWFLVGAVKGNSEFLVHWRQVATDLTALDHSDSENFKSMGGRMGSKVQKLIQHAPLYQLYHVGATEITHRISNPSYGGCLSGPSIQAIRASLDGAFVRQNQIINDGLVFLTISIAGGPFIGLLGTVAGVMITFASIAATGEVNINAIAPGIAAALVATLAGLLVAIPALLGYNYLMSQVKNVTTDMQIFIDEFVTKMAEFYRPKTDQPAEFEGAH